ncbi:hypothetical protein PsYK624_131720 [Phanerochaete sordida]|uniref:Uncharacterized protein n=1 Tax=Phanerochaete sordida TaxID=48140 RepID=A0A9P3GKJ7_9APHY|nr:hypothetical protein PsYK624_131720 [Phanerochaete sordida]
MGGRKCGCLYAPLESSCQRVKRPFSVTGSHPLARASVVVALSPCRPGCAGTWRDGGKKRGGRPGACPASPIARWSACVDGDAKRPRSAAGKVEVEHIGGWRATRRDRVGARGVGGEPGGAGRADAPFPSWRRASCTRAACVPPWRVPSAWRMG